MSTFKLEIACDNAAFGDGPMERSDEVARIVKEAMSRLEITGPLKAPVRLKDANGNTVGRYWWEGD